MAELLILAQESYGNDADTSAMSPDELALFETRFRKGDVIVVRPDGHTWGRDECPPRFVVARIPGISFEFAKKYEDSLGDDKSKKGRLKHRKHGLTAADVDAILAAGGTEEMTHASFMAKVKVKTK